MTILNQSGVCKLLLSVLLVSITACASNKPYKDAVPGLVEVSHSQYFDRVLLPPGAILPAFSKVYIELPEVSMSDYWLKSFRGDYTERDLERIKTSYSKMLKESLGEQLAKNEAFHQVESAAEADVIFRATLDSLNIYAPDLSYHGRVDHYIHEAGNATFNLQIVAVSDGAVLGQFVDHSETFSNPGIMSERADRITNARYFGRLMDRWARNLMTYLTDANALSPASGSQ